MIEYTILVFANLSNSKYISWKEPYPSNDLGEEDSKFVFEKSSNPLTQAFK